MKKITVFLFLSTFLFSCEEVVDIKVPSREPKLVIEAVFEVFFDDIPITAYTDVKLSLSTDYFEEDIPIVTSAIVTLKNLSDGVIIDFEDLDLDGNYLPVISFIPEDNIEYELSVIYNNEIYKGIASKIRTPKFINVEQGVKTLFSGKETEVIVEFPDDANKQNFYLFNFSKNFYLSIEDRFFNGSNYNFSFFYQEDEVELPTNVKIKMSGVSRNYYTYFRVLANQSGQSGGAPFQTIPSSLLGNIINTTNTKNFPLGYFHIAETDTYNLSLIE